MNGLDEGDWNESSSGDVREENVGRNKGRDT